MKPCRIFMGRLMHVQCLIRSCAIYQGYTKCSYVRIGPGYLRLVSGILQALHCANRASNIVNFRQISRHHRGILIGVVVSG